MDVAPPPAIEIADDAGYRLYVFPFSLYSIMARFTHALGKVTSNDSRSVLIKLELVNLHRNENIAEGYLRSVNPKGQVPALTGPGLDPPLTDSLDISYWLCSLYPKLLPSEYEVIIRELLSKLHDIQALSLSVTREEDRSEGVPCPTDDVLLAKEDVSFQYRQALEYKRNFHKKHLEFALEDENIAIAETQAKELFTSVMALSNDQAKRSMWILGDDAGPTVLDAHLVPFIVRLLDCGRGALVPEKLETYANKITGLPSWQEVTHGRSTVWDISIGHVHLLKDI